METDNQLPKASKTELPHTDTTPTPIMNPQEINKRIAIACKLDVVDEPDPKDRPEAWKTAFFTQRAATIRKNSWPSSAVVKVVPNYHGDLNAMHEAEKILKSGANYDFSQRDEYIAELECLVLGRCDFPYDHFRMSTCSAAQRAEAFLRTIGQWEDEK
jgi:hypothetical protein